MISAGERWDRDVKNRRTRRWENVDEASGVVGEEDKNKKRHDKKKSTSIIK